MQIGSITCKELTDGSPVFSVRRDVYSAKRMFTCAWEDAVELGKALRGSTTISGSYFSRTLPHQFFWQGLDRQFACVDVPEIKGAGLPRNNAGAIDTTRGVTSATLVTDVFDVGFSDKAHLTAEYQIPPYAVIGDDDVDDPITPTGAFDYDEWDRFTEWNADFSTELISIPQGAYKYQTVAVGQQVNQMIRIPISSARISATVYGLPMIPQAAMRFQGSVNDSEFTFFLRPVDGTGTQSFTCAPETLLYLNPKTVSRSAPNGDRYYDVTYYFSYRDMKAADNSTTYGHNAAPYYNPSTKKVSFERIAVDTTSSTTAKADLSAPFRLRNFGYFWSPSTPPIS